MTDKSGAPKPKVAYDETIGAKHWFMALGLASAIAFCAGGLTAFGIDRSVGTSHASTSHASTSEAGTTPDATGDGGGGAFAPIGKWVGLTEPALGKGPLFAFRRVEPAADPQAAPEAEPHLPAVLLIIDDMGLNAAQTRAVMRLPDEVTLSFLPYGRNVGPQARAAHDGGHEVMLHMPMEPMGGANPGPIALRTRLNAAEFDRVFIAALSIYDGFVGVNNHMGSKLTADRNAMEHVMGVLEGRGIIFVDSRTSQFTVAAETAELHHVPNVSRDVFLDHGGEDRAGVLAALARTEDLARRNGRALAIGHPRPATLDAIMAWHEGLAERGVRLVTLTDYMKVQPAPPPPARIAATGSSHAATSRGY